MHYYTLTFSALAVLSVHAGCKDAAGRNCYWQGRAPGCGTPYYNLGQMIRGNELVASTAEIGISQLLENKNITEGCYDDYGGYCLFGGHKNLFCAPLGEKVNSGDESDNPTTPMANPQSSEAASPSAAASAGSDDGSNGGSNGGFKPYSWEYLRNADGSLEVTVTFSNPKYKPCKLDNVELQPSDLQGKLDDLIKKTCEGIKSG